MGWQFGDEKELVSGPVAGGNCLQLGPSGALYSSHKLHYVKVVPLDGEMRSSYSGVCNQCMVR